MDRWKKVAFSESLNWEKSRITPNSMKVLPVSFAAEHKQMSKSLQVILIEITREKYSGKLYR
jgi:hypothetical protein